jgi:hypothetical protein
MPTFSLFGAVQKQTSICNDDTVNESAAKELIQNIRDIYDLGIAECMRRRELT